MKRWSWVALLACGCGGRTEPLIAESPPAITASSTDAGLRDVGSDVGPPDDVTLSRETGSAGGCSAPPDLGPSRAAACTGEVATCDLGGDGCHFTALEVTLRPLVLSCGAYCGELAVAVREGCVSDLAVVSALGTDGLRSPSAIVQCLERQIFGRSWSCARPDRWYPLYVGSCNTR